MAPAEGWQQGFQTNLIVGRRPAAARRAKNRSLQELTGKAHCSAQGGLHRKLKELAPIKVGKKLESDIGNLETLVQAAWSLYIGISITIIVYRPI